MAFDEKLADRVRAALAGKRGLSERKMMGGICFMVAGNMCCGVTGAALMVRVGPDGYTAALAKPHVRPLEFAGRRPGGFVLVDPPGFSRSFAKWIRTGTDVAAALPKKAAKRKAPKKARARNG